MCLWEVVVYLFILCVCVSLDVIQHLNVSAGGSCCCDHPDVSLFHKFLLLSSRVFQQVSHWTKVKSTLYGWVCTFITLHSIWRFLKRFSLKKEVAGGRGVPRSTARTHRAIPAPDDLAELLHDVIMDSLGFSAPEQKSNFGSRWWYAAITWNLPLICHWNIFIVVTWGHNPYNR